MGPLAIFENSPHSPLGGRCRAARAARPGGSVSPTTLSSSFHLSSFAMRWTVPVPMPKDLATLKIPTPFASCFRTLRLVALWRDRDEYGKCISILTGARREEIGGIRYGPWPRSRSPERPCDTPTEASLWHAPADLRRRPSNEREARPSPRFRACKGSSFYSALVGVLFLRCNILRRQFIRAG
jgi:hypothetical protein